MTDRNSTLVVLTYDNDGTESECFPRMKHFPKKVDSILAYFNSSHMSTMLNHGVLIITVTVMITASVSVVL